MTQALIPFAKRVEFEKNDWVMTYRGMDKYGQEFFCYILCDLAGYTKMQNDWLNKVSDLPSSYGKVIYRDSIKNPDEKAVKFLENWRP